MKMNRQEDIELIKQRFEKEFIKAVNKGEDIRSYLYLPYEYLSEKVKNHIDEFLLEQAYKEIDFESFSNSIVVYRDGLITVKLEKKLQQIDLLEKLLTYYADKEEYDKCIKIRNLLDFVKLN
jgi:hypothetical protein